MFTKKTLLIILMVSTMASILYADGTIVFVSLQDGIKIDPVTGEYPDMPHIYALQNAGYNVIVFYNASLSTASQETLDTLDNANLIVLGRSTPSTIYGDHKQAWNDLKTPILNLELWNCRSNRLNWFNTTNMVSLTAEDTVYNAVINVPDDPVFEGLDTSAPIPWVDGPFDAVGVTEAGNGIVLARMEPELTVLFVRFEPDFEFYDGAGDYPAGHRTVLGNGRDVSGAAPFSYYNFTPESEQVFLAEVARLVALGGGTAVEDRENTSTPTTFVLSQNYPNPFNPTTTIEFILPVGDNVDLTLMNILGQVVKELASGYFSAGRHEVVVDASGFSSGIYFYRFQAGSFVDLKKLVVSR